MRLSEHQKEVRAGVVVVLVIATGMTLLTWTGMLYPWQTLGVDAFLNTHNFRTNNIRLIAIEEDDYRSDSLFGGQSPLRRDCVEKLIDAVAKAGPQLIVVDLDLSEAIQHSGTAASRPGIKDECQLSPVPPGTKNHASSGEEKSFPRKVEDNFVSRNHFSPPTIIWAQTIKEETAEESVASIIPLAGLPPERAALPIFPSDRDGKIRAFWTGRIIRQDATPTDPASHCFFRLTFAGAVARQVGESREYHSPEPIPCVEKIDEEKYESYLVFSRDPNTFAQSDTQSVLRSDTAALREDLKGKIVIIGGEYGAARDVYFTPLGRMSGMKLVAYSIRSALRDQKSSKTAEWASFLADLVMGCTLVWVSLQKKWSAWVRISASLFLLCSLPLVASYIVYRSGNYFLNFMPVMLGAGLHTAYDSWKERLEERFKMKYAGKKRETQVRIELVEARLVSEVNADTAADEVPEEK